ncbi:unnamed protein product, partial [Rotaria sordida]
LPHNNRVNGNVEQFEVTFYSPDEKKINDNPILSNRSPKEDRSKPAELNSTQIPSDRPVSRLEITILKTTDSQSPKGVVLDIKACTEAITETTTITPLSTISSVTEKPGETGVTSVTTGITGTQSKQLQETSSGAMLVSTIEGSTPAPTSLTTLTGSTIQPVSGTTPKECEEMQAIDENVSKKITTSSNTLPRSENIKFLPTSPEGVSFDENDRTPTITVNFDKPTNVRSVTLPHNNRVNGNVEQFEVTFYSPDEKKINDNPILSNRSPKEDRSKPAELNSTQIPSDRPVSRLEITIVKTTDSTSPKGVVLDIKACTEAITETTTVTPLSTISSVTEKPGETGVTSVTTGITGTQSKQLQETSSGVMLVSTIEGSTPAPTSLTILTGSTTQPVSGTTPKECEEMQAIDEN